ncbi:hypothetical protein SEA_GIANTSBANE_67 [Arthrobacter phage Giantsbane]|nr:hypothetical protein SEA_GIANTSBANE_67 [Arthrobacter phage Giantsbane]
MKKFWSIICVLFGMLFIAGCGPAWTGTGIVVDKNQYDAGYRPVTWSNKNQWQDACFELVVRDSKTKKLEKSCVSEHVWDDAMLDHQITITEDYK